MEGDFFDGGNFIKNLACLSMISAMKTDIFIDGANLHKSSKDLGFGIDYRKFYRWLRQKYGANNIYLFLGFIQNQKKNYKKLEEYGYLLIFKETVNYLDGKIKGNCDAELVLKVCNDFYENNLRNFILITSDGDFACLIDFLINKNSKVLILSPNKKKCSFLLKKTKAVITDLVDHYHKFSNLK